MKKKSNNLQKTIFIILISTIILLITIGIIYAITHALFYKEVKEKKVNYNIPKPVLTKRLLTKNKNSRPGKKLKKVNGIVIHYTANPGTSAEANRNYFESRKDCPSIVTNKVSSHYIIGIEGEIIQCIPENEIAYASNYRNNDTISIECCHKDKSGKFSTKTYQSLIRLSAYLCAKYNIEKKAIIRHYDITRKLCPLYYVKHKSSWKKMKSDIIAYKMKLLSLEENEMISNK